MNQLKVMLWGRELGRLVWNPAKLYTYVIFNPEARERPDIAPIMLPVKKWNPSIPVYGDDRKFYQRLPTFLADSLPDSWGDQLFDQWVKENGISRKQITPLFKLMFIGRRGMGALEFEPAVRELEHVDQIDINKLYTMSLEVLEDRISATPGTLDNLTMQSLIAVGTSAGGRQMKAIIAVNPETKEVRSGQIDGLDGFDYKIVKFRDHDVPTTEIEMAYYEMAIACGINMEACEILTVDGTPHFMTQRFDRKNGEKVHMQTLAAINPEAESYEDLMSTCMSLGLSDSEMEQLFRRMVFNVLANNTDDHNKNFSFLLEKEGKWRLSPAYDLTFIFNRYGTGAETERCLSLYGKLDDITKEDLTDFAKEFNIRRAGQIISEVAAALSRYPELADKYNIPQRWSNIINKTINDNLFRFGLMEKSHLNESFTDSLGRTFNDISLETKRKGYLEVRVKIDCNPRKRIIGPKSNIYQTILDYDAGKLDITDSLRLFEELFTSEN